MTMKINKEADTSLRIQEDFERIEMKRKKKTLINLKYLSPRLTFGELQEYNKLYAVI